MSKKYTVFAIMGNDNKPAYFGYTTQHPMKRFCDLKNSAFAPGTVGYNTPISQWFRAQYDAYCTPVYTVKGEYATAQEAKNRVTLLVAEYPDVLNAYFRQAIKKVIPTAR